PRHPAETRARRHVGAIGSGVRADCTVAKLAKLGDLVGMLELGAIDLEAGMSVAKQRLRHGFHHARLARAGWPRFTPHFCGDRVAPHKESRYATSQMDWRDELENGNRIHDSCDSTDRYGLATGRGANLLHASRLQWNRRLGPNGRTHHGRSREPLRHYPIRRHGRLRFGLQAGQYGPL